MMETVDTATKVACYTVAFLLAGIWGLPAVWLGLRIAIYLEEPSN